MLTSNEKMYDFGPNFVNPPMVKPFRLTYLASLNLNHCLSDLLLIVDLWTHPRSTRIQIKNCQYS